LAFDTFDLNLGPVLVTGGTGFLGRRLVERLLAQGREVTVLARRPAPDLEKRGVRLVAADLSDSEAVRSACRGVETVFHVAAKVGPWGRYDDFFRANVLGTRAILEGCRTYGVRRLVYTSTPSVVYDGRDLAGADESLPLTTRCPAAYPLTKAIAEREVLAANSPELSTVALRPHLIWGVGDPHLVPRIIAQARAGRLRIVGSGRNRVDLVHVENAVDAHLLAEQALSRFQAPSPRSQKPPSTADRCHLTDDIERTPPSDQCHLSDDIEAPPSPAAGKAYFITNGEPVVLWDWINDLLRALDIPPVTKHLSLGAATVVGGLCEALWRMLPLGGEPPITRFVAKELATDHWFDISAARRDLGYGPRVSMAAGTAELVASLTLKARDPAAAPLRKA
jgi:nucleoside-diphosphate-sugar epimerase